MINALVLLSKDIDSGINLDMTILEIHNLAYFYHWGYDECWKIPVNKRKVFNDRIRQQLKAENNGGSSSPSPSNYRENTSRF